MPCSFMCMICQQMIQMKYQALFAEKTEECLDFSSAEIVIFVQFRL